MDQGLTNKFLQFQEQIYASALMQRQYAFYSVYIVLVLCGFVFSLYALTLSTSVWIQMPNAVFFAFVSIQAGMLGHDFSHGQVFASRRLNRLCALIIWGLAAGLSEQAWYAQHNDHHTEVNRDGHDPDLNIPFLFSPVQHSGNYTLPSWTWRHQHILFFVSLPVWYASKLFITWTEDPARTVTPRGLLELLLAVLHFAGLFYLVFHYLPVLSAVLFLAVYFTATGFYMGSAFAPNHKGEEISTKDTEITWLHQITSTRNLYPSWISFYMLGGLGFQVEHHLFPGMPRVNYWALQKQVKMFCADNNIRYHETTWIGSMREIYAALKTEASRQ